MKKRTYSKYSYTDAYLWESVISDEVKQRISKVAGSDWVSEVQIANLQNKLQSLGKSNLWSSFVEHLEESDLIEWKP